MIRQLLLTWSTLMSAASAPEQPILCVDAQAAPALEEEALVAALRARVARPEVRVERCGALSGVQTTWHLSVEQVEPERVALIFTGEGLSARRFVATGVLNREEQLQQIALTAAEAVRPSIEHRLAQPGQSPPEEDLVAALEAQVTCPPPEPCPEPQVVRAQPPLGLDLTLSLGPLLGLPAAEAAGLLELRAGLLYGPLELALHSGARSVIGPDSAAATLGGVELELGLNLLWRWQQLRAGLRAQSRLAALSFTPGTAAGSAGARLFWRSGYGALAELTLWRGELLSLGLVGLVWLWPQPNRLLVEGEVLYAQPYLELAIGLSATIGPFFLE